MLTFTCSCGQMLQVQDEFAGRQIRCPKCQTVATAPVPVVIQPVEAGPAAPPVVIATEFTETAPAAMPPPRREYDGRNDDRPRRRDSYGDRDYDRQDDRNRYDDRYDDRDRYDDDDRPRRRGRKAASGKAVAGMILGLCTFVLPILCAIPALILSFLGIRDVNRNPERVTGKGLAITGIIAALLGNVTIFAYVGVGNAISTGRQRVALKNDMMQIGIAMHSYHDANRCFPPAGLSSKAGFNPATNKPNLSWRVALLPYLDPGLVNLYNQFNFDEPWDGPNNIKLLPHMPEVYKPRGASAPPGHTFLQVFTGPQALFRDKQKMSMVRVVDGTSNTILVAEAGEAVPWTKPADMAFDMNGPLPKLGAMDQRSFMALFADGSVRQIRRGNDHGLRLAICPDDGQPLPFDWDLGR